MNKDFKVEVREDNWELTLSITHNGYQWSSLRIADPEQEIPEIIKVLEQALFDHRTTQR